MPTVPPKPEVVARWVAETQGHLRQLSTVFRLFYGAVPELSQETESIIGQLAIRCTLTSDSALLLVSQEKLWDAEVLLRSVLEGSLRLAYMGMARDEEREARVREFVWDLPAVMQLRRHRRAAAFLASMTDPHAPQWTPTRELVLSDAEVNELQQRFPKSRQKTIESRWTLGSLLAALATGHPDEFSGLLVQYGLASQFAHADADSVYVAWERENRDEERRESVELAHVGRLCSDVIALAQLRAASALHAKRLDLSPLRECVDAAKSLGAEFSEASRRWRRIEYGTT